MSVMKLTQPKVIRFKFAPEKARAALHWMLNEQPMGLHAALKACYFADKDHLNKYGRPVFGATYRAMRFGPVPLEIYEMAKSDAIWLAELGVDRFPWRLDGHMLCISDNAKANVAALSESDMEALENGFKISIGMTFSARTAATHGKDWQAANLGIMRYEDMIDASPKKDETVAYLREAAPVIRL